MFGVHINVCKCMRPAAAAADAHNIATLNQGCHCQILNNRTHKEQDIPGSLFCNFSRQSLLCREHLVRTNIYKLTAMIVQKITE